VPTYWCHDLDLSGSRDVSCHVTIWFPRRHFISYRCSIIIESLSPTIFEIMGIFYIWVTTLTFLGHVTLSFTWAIDPPYVISYWCPIVTEPLSLTVFEIFGPQNLCAHTDTHTHRNTDTHRKWFYILSHAMYCVGQTIKSTNRVLFLIHECYMGSATTGARETISLHLAKVRGTDGVKVYCPVLGTYYMHVKKSILYTTQWCI